MLILCFLSVSRNHTKVDIKIVRRYITLYLRCITLYLIVACRKYGTSVVPCLAFIVYFRSMKENEKEDLYKALKLAVEQRFGKGVVVSSDFAELSAKILETTGTYLAPITLRRFWSEKECACYNVTPRRSTLNILSQYVGCGCWDNFARDYNVAGLGSSDFILKADLPAAEVKHGCVLELTWVPDRLVRIVSSGSSVFRVLESRNSKLSAGDTFRTELFIEGEPLLLTDLVHEGGAPAKYVCGKVDGIRYKVFEE